MANVLIARVAAAWLAIAGSALAADLPRKAPPAAPSWSGFYAGVSLGARWADNDWQTSNIGPGFGPGAFVQTAGTGGSIDSLAARIGGYLGYNAQIASAWVAGVEADLGWANNSRTANPLPGTAALFFGAQLVGLPTGSVAETWDGGVRARLGYLVTPASLIYVTGGVAWQRLELNASCSVVPGNSFCVAPRTDSFASTRVGWTIGGGFEQLIGSNWIARVDYRYADFGSVSRTVFAGAFGVGFDDRFDSRIRTHTHTATVGLAYRF